MFELDPDDTDQRRKFTRRAMLVGAGQLGALAVLSGRLWQLQVTEESRYALLAEENRINVQMTAPERGRVLDRFGEVLAGNRESYRAVVVPSLARDVKGVIERFTRLVPLASEEQARIVQRARRQSPNLPIVIVQDLTFEQIAEINLNSPHLAGIRTEAAPRRHYSHGRTIGHIVGYTGAYERLAMDDDPVLRLPGMRVGKAGVERGMEDLLRGRGGNVKSEVDSRGRIIRHLDEADAIGGRDVVLTIDLDLQGKIMARLGEYRRAAAVVLDAAGGDVVAMASVPSFETNDIVAGVTQPSLPSLAALRDDPMINRAARGLYPPGSTFKMVTGLAALEAGVIDLKERLPCSGSFEYFDKTFRCWKRSGHGSCDFHRALRESCDCYFYELARRTGITAIAGMARRLGLGQIYDCGLAQQKRGLVPDQDWKRGRLNRAWYGGETILAGIGQGYVLATPFQLAVMTARLATGRNVLPTVARPVGGAPAAASPPLALRAEWLAAIRRGMAAVVNEDGGTGAKARPENGDYLIAGKTGTSQVSRFSSETAQADLRWDLRDHALFVCYAPAERPRYVVAVVVEHGGGGGATAAPLARDILAMAMERDPLARPVYPATDAGVARSGPDRTRGKPG